MINKTLFHCLLTSLLLLFSQVHASVTAHINPSRTIGVAPLAVHFDASGTTATSTNSSFHDLHYVWDYGDPGSGYWSTSGWSKNQDVAPIGGHVYEEPGVYTVTLQVKDASGATDTETVTITVQDPDSVFAGSNTVCISTGSNFSGAPAGASLVTTSSWSTVISHLGAGKRVLLRRGDSWTHSGSESTLAFQGPAILGAFGSGPRPKLNLTSADVNVFRLGHNGIPRALSDLRIMDLEVDGNSHRGGFAIVVGEIQNVTLLRIHAYDLSRLFIASPSGLGYWNDFRGLDHKLPRGIAIVDTDFQRVANGGGSGAALNVVYAGIRYSLFMGNVWNDSTQGEHVLRMPTAQYFLLSHNILTNSAQTKHALKLHSAVTNGLVEPGVPGYSHRIVISDNYFESELSNWPVSIEPQNKDSNEYLEDIVIDRNTVLLGSLGNTAFRVSGTDATLRNNLAILTPGGGGTAFAIVRRGIEPISNRSRVYNNSAFSGASGGFALVSMGLATNSIARNNLGSAPNASNPTTVAGGGSNLQASHNLVTNNPGWVTSNPINSAGFALTSGSAAINAGTAVPVFEDFVGTGRPDGSTWDLGAYEYEGGGGGGPIAVTGVSLSPSSLSLTAGQSGQLSATVSPANASNQNVTWSSSNTAVATVNASGLVVAVAQGTALITVTTQDGAHFDQSSVSVSAPPSGDSNVALGKSVTASDWQDDSVGYQPPAYLVDGDTGGNSRWSAQGFSQWAQVDLGSTHALSEIRLYPYLSRAYRYTIEISTNGSSWSTIVDRSNNTESGTVLVDALSGVQGRYVRLTVVGAFNYTGNWVSINELEVFGSASGGVAVTGVEVSPGSLSLGVSGTAQLSASVTPSNATDPSVSWSSSNTSVATVSSSGSVTAIGPGSAIITATTNDGSFTDTASVTVTASSGDLVSYGDFSGSALIGMPNPYVVGSDSTDVWLARTGTCGQCSEILGGGSNPYVAVGTGNTNGTFQVLPWPGNGILNVSFNYRGSPRVRVLGGNTGDTIAVWNGANTLDELDTATMANSGSWTSGSLAASLSGSYDYVVIQFTNGGDIDDVSATLD